MNENMEIKNREIILSKRTSKLKHDYNKHVYWQVHIHNQVAEKFLTDEMNANFFTTNSYVQNDEEAPFLTQHTKRAHLQAAQSQRTDQSLRKSVLANPQATKGAAVNKVLA